MIRKIIILSLAFFLLACTAFVKKNNHKEAVIESEELLNTSQEFDNSTETPNDFYFNKQWALNNTGQKYYKDSCGIPGADIKALNGWEWTTGCDDVIIAIIGTGVAIDHEDLKNKVVTGYNVVEPGETPYDDNGHDTFMASIAAAEANNGVGVVGVSWNAKIMPVKVYKNGAGKTSDVATGIRWATDNGADIINLSLMAPHDDSLLRDACKYAYNKGVVLVASSGNQYASKVYYPAAYDEYCIAVCATNADDKRWEKSNYGPQIDVAAPGVDIIGASFDPKNPTDLSSYDYLNSGTSQAAAHVSGAVALLLSSKPSLSNLQVMERIKNTADDINKAEYPGVDQYIGYGRINLQRLLEADTKE